MLNAVNNMIKSTAGVLAPALGVLIKKQTGSYAALFYSCAVLHAGSALVFALRAKITPASRFREASDEKDAEEESLPEEGGNEKQQ